MPPLLTWGCVEGAPCVVDWTGGQGGVPSSDLRGAVRPSVLQRLSGAVSKAEEYPEEVPALPSAGCGTTQRRFRPSPATGQASKQVCGDGL